ncbi:MAG: type I DNA topoisomerase [Candidatus Omnitrophota bacterium]|jgi:DNA topoisomerase-1
MKNKGLVIVESPTKAKTISKILGRDFTVVSTMGHLYDLPSKKLGVDIEKGFEPEYTILVGRNKILASLKKEAKDKDVVYLATDPDREGEAIGWHLKDKLFKKQKVLRVTFHEITPAAVSSAFKHPRDFDSKMIEAQGSRRILDRLVGYFLSPLLWKKISRGLSAGRVQSVALRLIIDKEREIQKFVPQEYWEIEAQLGKAEAVFKAKLEKIDAEKAQIKNGPDAERICADIKTNRFKVTQIKKTEKKRNPEAPFITSTLQQEAFNKLRFNATKTMIIAQQLYEGIDIGQENPVGLISYMRTDSPKVAPEAIAEVRNLIKSKFGKDYLPDEANVYKVRKLAQEAHEAIRPTLIARPAESLQTYLSAEQYKLYELIYNRFLSSQMTSARYLSTSVDIKAGKYLFSASGSVTIFDGFTALYNKNGDEKEKNTIPDLEEGMDLALLKLTPSQHFTKPPARYSDSSLVKALEEDGIGRPSTYAPIIYTLLLRNYARRVRGYFQPSELGFMVCDLLVEYFPKIMDIGFTALMEEELDEVEEGKADKLKVLKDFYEPFKISLDYAQANIKKEVVFTDQICDKCGKPLVVKWGRRGKFLSCSGFPTCKNSKSITTGIKCPQPGCTGELIERRSKRGFFFGCSNFPKCTFTSKTLPSDKEQGKEAEE